MRRRTGFWWLVCLPLLFSTWLLAGPWQEGFEAYPAGSLSSQGGWDCPGGQVVEGVARSGKKCLQINQATTVNYTVVASRALDFQGLGQTVWLDFYLRTPATPRVVMVEVQKKGKMVAAAGAGMGESPFAGAYLLRTSRAGSIRWPRLYQPKVDIYTGRNNDLPLGGWVHLTLRLDLSARTFDVYREGNCVYSDLEMATDLPETGDYKLVVTAGPGEENAAFCLDDFSLGSQPPEVKIACNWPVRPANTLLRLVVVGDTQIGPGDVRSKNTIYSSLGMVVQAINRLEPDLVLFVGDLVNIGGDKAQHQSQAEAYYPVWLEEIRRLKTPYLTVPGNHDPHRFYQKFIRPEIDYSFEKNGYTLVAFSSSHPEDPDGWGHHGQVSQSQLTWLEEEMKKAVAKGNRIITFTHITSHPNQHPLVGWYIKEGGQPLRELYRKYRVVAEMSGHMHRWMVNWQEDGTWYIVVPEVMGSGGMYPGQGLAVYDILPDRWLQYEKPTRMPYLTDWGNWAKPVLTLPGTEK
ncbi:MAG TPA: metallophosphoesterase [bacterium]|mgnify:CR=1 FL=1|nr:metallophosphoesterase [bacterium]